MIQIDESGWGSLIGGVAIGVYNTRNKKFFSGIIPVEYFQIDKFSMGWYRLIAVSIIATGIDKVGTKLGKGEIVQICRGPCLITAKDFLLCLKDKKAIKEVQLATIKDPLQAKLEEKFSASLAKLGVPNKSGKAHRLSFDDMLAWVKRSPKKRIQYVKTGWESWQKKYKNLVLGKK